MLDQSLSESTTARQPAGILGRAAPLALAALALAAFALAGPFGCSGNDNDRDDGDRVAVPDDDENGSDDPAAQPGGDEEEPEILRAPWHRARPGQMAVYREYDPAGDETAATDERWVLLNVSAAPAVRVYTGGGLGPFGLEPEMPADRSLEVPSRGQGVGERNWWFAEPAAVSAEPADVTLPSGQTLAAHAIRLEDGRTVWVSEAAPFDGVVRVEDDEGRVQRELVAHGAWLGPWQTEEGAVVWFRGTHAIVGENGEEEQAYTVERTAEDGAVTLALLSPEGERTDTWTLRPQADGSLTLTDEAGTETRLTRE